MQYCVINTCKNFLGVNYSDDLHVFKTQHLEPERHRAWIEEIRKHQPISECFFRICELHFEERFIVRPKSGMIRLTKDAVPTIFKQKSDDVPKNTYIESGTTKVQSSIRTYSRPKLLNGIEQFRVVSAKNTLPTTTTTTAPINDWCEPKIEPIDEDFDYIIPSPEAAESQSCVNCVQQNAQMQELQTENVRLQEMCEKYRLEANEYKSKLDEIEKKYFIETCAVCNATYSAMGRIEHICNGEREIACDYCVHSFRLTAELVEHLRVYHREQSIYRCDLCPKVYAMEILLQFHGMSHRDDEPQLKCDDCDDEFYTFYQMRNHMNQQHSNEEKCHKLKPYQCGDCDECFETGRELTKHFRSHKPTFFECFLCKANFRSLAKTRSHLKEHERNEQCPVCMEKCTKNELDVHMCDGQKSVECEYCKKTCHVMKDLLQHLEHCNKEKLFYKCDKCCKIFKMQSIKDLHMKYHREILKEYNCDVCTKSFTQLCGLKLHKEIHNDRSYLCDECGKSFKTTYNLRDHQRIHGERLFKCSQCDKSYTDKSKLKTHSLIHQNFKFVCDICGVQLSNPPQLKRHKALQTRTEADRKYPCNLCSKKFFTEKTRAKHMNSTHRTGQPFECDFCGQKYKYSGDLNKHLRMMHLGDDMYHCTECSKRFRLPNELYRHKFEHYKPPEEGNK